MLRQGTEEARDRLPELLDAAEKGRCTLITRRGRPVAVLEPISAYRAGEGATAADALARIGPRLVGKRQRPYRSPVARGMEPLDFGDLPEEALLLIDSSPIIYILEDHPQFAPRFAPLFAAHAAGRLRFAVTTTPSPRCWSVRCGQATTRWRSVTKPYSNRGSPSRSMSISPRVPRGCGLRSA